MEDNGVLTFEPHEKFTSNIIHLAHLLQENGISTSKRNKTIRYRRLRIYPLTVVENERYDGLYELCDTLDNVLYTMLTEKEVLSYIMNTIELESDKNYRTSVFAAQSAHDEAVRKNYIRGESK